MNEQIEAELKRIEGDNVYYNHPDLSRLIAALRLYREHMFQMAESSWISLDLLEAFDNEVLDLLKGQKMTPESSPISLQDCLDEINNALNYWLMKIVG